MARKVAYAPNKDEIKIDMSNTGDPREFQMIDGIESLEITPDKTEDDTRELGQLYPENLTTAINNVVSIGGHYRKNEETGERSDVTKLLSDKAFGEDDRCVIRVENPMMNKEMMVRVSGSSNSEFANKYEWSFELELFGEPYDIDYFEVKFDVDDGTDAIEDATVTLVGYGEQTTDATGEAIFDEVGTGKWDYTVTHPEHPDQEGTITVVDADIVEPVSMTA